MRKRIGKIVWGGSARWSHHFEYAVLGVILVSMVAMSVATIPGISLNTLRVLQFLEVIVVVIFTIEYGIRIWTAEKPLRYIFSFLGIVDLIAIVPFWLATGVNLQGARAFRFIQMIRMLKVLRYMKALNRLEHALRLVREELIIFGVLAVILIFITAVGIYHFENGAQPEAFPSIPQSIWFSVVSLTGVGYGDVTPVTLGGKIFTSFILIIGLGIVAVPTALIVSGLTRVRLLHTLSDNQENDADLQPPARRK